MKALKGRRPAVALGIICVASGANQFVRPRHWPNARNLSASLKVLAKSFPAEMHCKLTQSSLNSFFFSDKLSI